MSQSNMESTTNEVVWEMTEDIVISGISGRFPESDNIDELTKNLMDNVDMITEDDRRWPIGLYGLPTRSGKIKDLSKFDAQFFGVHGKQANLMDPQARLLLELTYEALCDAGMNPQTLRGTRTGVYVGACVSEVEEGLAQDVSKVSGYALTGCSRSMFANRISYTFDFQGPSYAMDTACSSSFLALQQAILGMRSAQCERAIVGGVNICLRPVTALQFHKLNMLSNDGKCKHLDASANGYVRAEACAVILLQKLSEAKRIYATVIHAKTNTDGYKKEGITYPSGRAQRELMQEVCQEAKINPLDVKYVEAHGTGTKIGDPIEIGAIADVYCNGRDTPLMIGGVKSNLGHSEPSSGLCSLAKVLIAFENKCIPANLHFSEPNPDIEPLKNGSIKPVIENTPYNGGLAAVNSFGFGGVNVHVIIKSHDKDLTEDSYKVVENIPRLVNMCGRTEQSVNYVFDFIEQNEKKVTREFLAMINEISKISSTSGMNYRGSMLLKNKTEENESFTREVVRVPEKKPIWFVFSGMGSQWPAMAKALMPLKVFANAIHFCADILKPFGVDLLHLLLEDDEAALDTTVAPFVSIAAVQIGLVDVLRACGIEPDGIVGHSVGELGCAYADYCFDAKQMILSAYWRGKCVEDHHVEKGLMAAVGMTWEDCLKRCPKGVVPACHNSEDSVTISGPYEETKKFVAQLKSENIFAREVKSCDVAFHSPYVGPIGPELMKRLQNILTPKLRSSKWISSSVPEDRWNEDKCKYSAPEYYVNNLVSPVLFHGATKKLPKNGIMIEIAPHTLLQAILKRSLGPEMTYIGLMKRGNNDNNLDFLFQSLGKLYQLGLNPTIENLYEKVEFPVPRGTQSTGSLIKFDHSQNWLVTQYPEYFNPSSSSDYVVKVDLQEAEDQYLAGHNIDGRVLYPATGYLMLAWKMLAKIKGQFHDKIPVEFENVTIHRATLLPKTGQTKFVIRMMETSGEFSISEGSAIVATGRVFVPEDPVLKMSHIVDENVALPENPNCLKLTPKDLYKELRVRGYDYGPTFQGLTEATEDGRLGKVKWSGSWISFADACLQMTILSRDTRALFLPVRFQCVRCDPRVLLSEVAENAELPVAFDRRINVCATKGLEIKGVRCNIAPRRPAAQNAVLENYTFIPHDEQCALTKTDKHEVEEYIRVTSTVARKVFEQNGKKSVEFQKIKDIDDDVVRRYLDADPTDFALLHTLQDIQNYPNVKNFDEKVNKAITRHRRDLPKDVLANVYIRERMLRPSLDIVAENSSKSLNVLEINASQMVISSTVKNHLELNGVAVSYTLAHPNPSDLGSSVPSDINVAEWNFLKSNAPADINNVDLVLYKDTSNNSTIANGVDLQTLLNSMYTMTRSNGFVLVFMRHAITAAESVLFNEQHETAERRIRELTTKASELGFSLINRKSDGITSTTLLFRKTSDKKIEDQTTINISSSNFKWVEEMKNILKDAGKKPEGSNVWLVANDTPNNGILGFVNCLRQEPNGDRIRCIFNNSASSVSVDFKKTPFNDILRNDLAMNVYKDGVLGSYRHISMGDIEEDGTCQTEHAYLNVVTRGDLSSLKWFESENKYCNAAQMKANETLCHVYYAPLNFRDIMLATGKLPPDALPGEMALQDCILGLEFAGRDSQGRRVMGMVPSKGLATTVLVTDPDFVWTIPDEWSMEEASTVPVAYSTAYYSLVVRGGLEPGESVLIHSGSGGVGQAAISICLSMGCEVFTTVGSQEKREFLKKQFPQLKDRNFANSRNTSFEQHVLRQTKGRGVDIVLNSLSEEKLHASLRCLAQHGRFLEIGKYDLSQNNPIGMSAFLKNIAFHGILLDCLFDVTPNSPPTAVAHKQMVGQLINEGIKTGAVKPLVSTVFSYGEAEEAFRFMATGKHVGKVLLKIRDEEATKVVKPTPMNVTAISRTVFNPTKCYVVTGGLGGFGLELAFWMCIRGAKNIILTSRSGPRDAYQKLSLKRLRSQGINVVVSNANVTTVEGTKKLIAEAKSMGGLGGVFHLAMVLRDGLFENQTIETFDDVCATKVTGLVNLDKLTRENCPEIEYFVTFSSVSCGRGNAGQTNYGYANSAMERVCEGRRSDGLHGLAVQWGAIGDVGIVLEKMGDNETIIGSTVPQRLPSCFVALDRFLQSPFAVCSSIVRSDKKTEVTSKSSHSLLEMITKILGLKNQSNLIPTITLAELGLDSLMGIEVKQTLERDYEVILSMSEIRSLTVNHLKEISAGNRAAIKETGNTAMQIDILMPFISIPTEVVVYLNDIKQGKPIFLLPPIDGIFDLLTPIAKLLKRPVIGLNWTSDLKDCKTVETAAAYYLNICKNIDSEGNFDVIGYSFGSVIAFEMALQEKVSNLILLDGSPSQLFANIQQYGEKVQAVSENQQQVEALVLLLTQYVSIDYAKTKAELLEINDVDARNVRATEIYLDNKGPRCEPEAIAFAAQAFYQKLKMIHEYRSSKKLDGNVFLIRAEELLLKNVDDSPVTQDYGLSEVITGECTVRTFKGNHKTFLVNNLKPIASVLNEKLC